jgi:hypothetical protein
MTGVYDRIHHRLSKRSSVATCLYWIVAKRRSIKASVCSANHMNRRDEAVPRVLHRSLRLAVGVMPRLAVLSSDSAKSFSEEAFALVSSKRLYLLGHCKGKQRDYLG